MPVWDDIDDAQVLQLAQDGDPEAFGELYERYAKIIFRFLYSHLYDRLDAEDLTEEVFLRAWRTLPNFRQQGVPFVAYLYHIARNAMIDHHRRSRHSSQDVSIEDGQVIKSSSNSAETATNNLEHLELRNLLVQLRDDYREVLILRFLSELSPEETAQAMDRSVGAVRVLQHRALAAMKKILVKNQTV
jgi:RNA polymerase sigma-70 factor (ECF subfamily)